MSEDDHYAKVNILLTSGVDNILQVGWSFLVLFLQPHRKYLIDYPLPIFQNREYHLNDHSNLLHKLYQDCIFLLLEIQFGGFHLKISP